MQQDPQTRRVFTILLHRAAFFGNLAPLAKRQGSVLRNGHPRTERLFQAAHDLGDLAACVSPRHAATTLLALLALQALIDGLLRLCTRDGDAGAAQQAVAPVTDAWLPGLAAPPRAPARAADTRPGPRRLGGGPVAPGVTDCTARGAAPVGRLYSPENTPVQQSHSHRAKRLIR